MTLIATCLAIGGQAFALSPADELNERLRNIAEQMKSVGQSLNDNPGNGAVLERQQILHAVKMWLSCKAIVL